MRDIRKYEVFQKAHKMAIEIYKVTSNFPKEEIYGITSQIRRAAYSIPVNIVEGGARESEKEFTQFINISIGFCEEVRYFLLFPKELGYINDERYKYFDENYEEIKKMLSHLYKKVSKNGNF